MGGEAVTQRVRGQLLGAAAGRERLLKAALGLTLAQTYRYVLLPITCRVIIPPLTNQYLNLTKNSSLAVAIGYPDLVSIANTTINQTGQAIEVGVITMGVYLLISLVTSAIMSFYGWRISRSMGG